MSERGHQRGGRGGGRGEHRGGRGGRGGHGGERGGHGHGGGSSEKPKKENILDLGKYMDKQVTVKFNGGREGMLQVSLFRTGENINNWCAVKGTLKGYDALMNLVLDDVEEKLTDDEGKEAWRSLGLVVARGTLLVGISPVDGSEEIANPFVQQEDE
ncbi:small nuclear ribonucleo protein [Rutstroemia sp. NJR-2017a BVV2]|nr:small nuclear ribonucleo protein [Rutstroemia sp. NJR-2017a BVV2]